MPDLPLVMLSLAVLAAAFYVSRFLPQPESRQRSVAKTVPGGLLALAAFFGEAHFLVVAALAVLAVGDAYLSREGEKNFLTGLGAFLAAHLLYIAYFTGRADFGAFLLPEVLASGAILLALAVLVLIRLWPHLGTLRIPVAGYALAIALMGLAARAAMPGFWVLAGVVLFIISDILLAQDKFTPLADTKTRRLMPYLSWVLYFAGQTMIVYGLIFTG